MTLYDICQEVAKIEEGLIYGEISFEYDKLMCVMKPGHPAELLDNVLSEVGWDAFEGKPVELDRVKEWAKDLKSFKSAFKIKELSAPIKHAQAYIKEQENESSTEKE